MKNVNPPVRFSFYSISLLILLAAFMVMAGCKSADKKAEHLTFAFGPDDAGTVQELIDVFNNQYKGEIKVDWVVAPRSTDEFYQQVKNDFAADEPGMDVIATDVIWTSALASQGWAADISKEFFAAYSPEEFVPATMNSVSYQFRIWGVPWYTDAGILFYRKDLLKKHGYEYPPTTWEELTTVSKDIMKKEAMPYGYVFQGADYEGGVTNACEFIWAAGGSILMGDLSVTGTVQGLEPEIITINSPEAMTGLETVNRIINQGIVPENIHEYKELEALDAFMSGQSVFMRSWTSAHGNFLQENSKLSADQVGLTPLPSLTNDLPSYSCLGGWNFVVNARISEEKKAAAMQFIQFMTSEKSQQYRLVKGGALPTRQAFYADKNLMAEAPVLELATQVLPICRERPKSPKYMEFSPVIATAFNRLLKKEYNPGEVMLAVSDELQVIMDK
ncbi:MAG: ABC transporter substrate-binding protein [Bacteroidota bacterium]